MEKKIKDFGRKIGGARKDLYSCAAECNFDGYSESEKHGIRRENIWKAVTKKDEPDDFLRLWKQKMRGLSDKEPLFYQTRAGVSIDQVVSNYVKGISAFRDDVMSISSEADIDVFYVRITEMTSKVAHERYMDVVFRSDILYSQYSLRHWHWLVAKRQNRKASATRHNRKQRYVPEQLAELKRTGPDWLKGHDTDADDWLKVLKFRGVEFGNWLSQNDRQTNLNMAFEALMDLADVLGVTPDSLTFHGKLALAFGSRGKGAALAHYEPAAEVINLTKMSGAGSLAHEWFHALDDQIAKSKGYYDTLATELPVPFGRIKELVDTMEFGPHGLESKYYAASKATDDVYAKSGGYWGSPCEMAARAFACYITDKLKEKGMRDDYLSAHSELVPFAIPQGEERKKINSVFDKLFADLKAEGFLTPADKSDLEYISETVSSEKKEVQKFQTPKAPAKKSEGRFNDANFREEKNGQLSFLF